MSPPLVVTREQAQTALRLFGEAVEEVTTGIPAMGLMSGVGGE
jgi:hypothetical protein